MIGPGSLLHDFRELDELARRDSPIHRMHPAVSTLVTLAFIVAVVSVPAQRVSRLLPFLLFPVAGVTLAGLPARPLLRRLIQAAPFAMLIAVPSLWLDRDPAGSIGPVPITGGMLTFASVGLRFGLTVGAGLVLVATTGIEGVLLSLRRLGLPRVLGVQLLLLHRYLFLLVEEASRMARARDLRGFGSGRDLRTWGALVGQILLRAFARAGRIHGAMEIRGFDGDIRLLRTWRLGLPETVFAASWIPAFIVFRLFDVPGILGALLVGGAH